MGSNTTSWHLRILILCIKIIINCWLIMMRSHYQYQKFDITVIIARPMNECPVHVTFNGLRCIPDTCPARFIYRLLIYGLILSKVSLQKGWPQCAGIHHATANTLYFVYFWQLSHINMPRAIKHSHLLLHDGKSWRFRQLTAADVGFFKFRSVWIMGFGSIMPW